MSGVSGSVVELHAIDAYWLCNIFYVSLTHIAGIER